MRFSTLLPLALSIGTSSAWWLTGYNELNCNADSSDQAGYNSDPPTTLGCQNFGFEAISIDYNYISSNFQPIFYTGAGCTGTAWMPTDGDGNTHCDNVENGIFNGFAYFQSYQVTPPS